MPNTALGLWSRFRRNRAALLSLVLLVAMLAACFATLVWTRTAMRQTNLADARLAPSRVHPLGTDDLGRDLLARTLYGGAISLSLGLLAAAVAVLIGTAYGAIAGYLGGRTDE